MSEKEQLYISGFNAAAQDLQYISLKCLIRTRSWVIAASCEAVRSGHEDTQVPNVDMRGKTVYSAAHRTLEPPQRYIPYIAARCVFAVWPYHGVCHGHAFESASPHAQHRVTPR